MINTPIKNKGVAARAETATPHTNQYASIQQQFTRTKPARQIDVEEIVRRVDLVHLVEEAGGHPRRVGTTWRAACPLHGGDNETAFVVYPGRDGRQRWHCFTGCQTGGDAIDFYMRWQGVDFLTALQALAARAGLSLDLSPEHRQALEERERFRAALSRLAVHYQEHLWRQPHALAYAHARGWDDEILRDEGLGFADDAVPPDMGHPQVNDMARRIARWAAQHGGALVYVHRDAARVVYLSLRSLQGKAHYNPPADLIGPRRAYANHLASRQRDYVLVVESPACALSLAQWGVPAVALCGTQADDDLVHRLVTAARVTVIPDGDGRTNLEAIADTLGPAFHVLPLPEGVTDVNDWHQQGATAEDLQALLDGAPTYLEVLADRAREKGTAESLRAFFTRFARLDPYERAARQEALRHRLGLGKRAFKALLRAALVQARDEASPPADGVLTDGEGQPLCNFDARIVREITLDDGLNPTRILFTLEGHLENGSPLPQVRIPAEDFEAMKWVPARWGARAIFYVPPRHRYLVAQAIQEHSLSALRRERVYTLTGWTDIDGRRLFLTASGGLATHGLDPSVRVDLGHNNLARYALPAPPQDPRPALRASLALLNLAPLTVTLPLWAALYAAPLGPIRTLDAVLWVYGPTQSGKSTLTHLALTHYGPTFIRGHAYRAPKDWTATTTDLEHALFVVKDAPIVIDDFAPAHAGPAQEREMRRKAHYVVRSVGNRSARGRAFADLSERPQRPPRGLVIATAENPLTGQSIVGRMVYIHVEQGDIFEPGNKGETALDRAQRRAEQGLYARAMSAYIAWLAGQWEEKEPHWRERLETLAREARGLFPNGQSRLMDYYAVLALGLETALACCVACGALSEKEAEAQAGFYRDTLAQVLSEQSLRVREQNPVPRFFQALADLLTQGKVVILPREQAQPTLPHVTLVGWYNEDKDQVYLLTRAALAEVRAYWERLGEPFATAADALRREMAQQGLVAERDATQLERKVYINREEGRKRVLVLDARLLEERGYLDAAQVCQRHSLEISEKKF